MRQILGLTAWAFCLHATTAFALEVTNLDKITHKVQVDVAGSKVIREIPPGRTENFMGQSNGFLTLLTAPHPNKGKDVVQSDGILSGIIGNNRNVRLPAEDRDAFVIWEGGELSLQQRGRGGRRNR